VEKQENVFLTFEGNCNKAENEDLSIEKSLALVPELNTYWAFLPGLSSTKLIKLNFFIKNSKPQKNLEKNFCIFFFRFQ
jgi:hypothetical protein